MSPRGSLWAVALGACCGLGALPFRASLARPPALRLEPHAALPAARPLPPPPPAPAAPPAPIELTLVDRNGGPAAVRACPLRLYDAAGAVDHAAVTELERCLGLAGPKRVGRRPEQEVRHLEPRLLQLVVKAAGRFGAREVDVVSSLRDRGRLHSKHKSGEAMDFALPGVPPKELAAFLRGLPRVGVGLYVHPRTQYVHLDVRPESYHWVDGSPPGRGSWGAPVTDPGAAARDASWTPEADR